MGGGRQAFHFGDKKRLHFLGGSQASLGLLPNDEEEDFGVLRAWGRAGIRTAEL